MNLSACCRSLCILSLLTGVISADDLPILTGPLASVLKLDDLQAPAGFDTPEEVMAAMRAGRIDLIDYTRPVADEVGVRRDIEYGQVGGHSLRLDLYSPRQREVLCPGLILIHGGAWVGGQKEDYRYYGLTFAEQGIVTVSIDYRLAQQALFPAAVQDCKCAVRWMRSHAEELGIDPERIAVMGGSAGGHLAMMVGYASDVPEFEGIGGHANVSSAVSAVVQLYGPVDFTLPTVLSNQFSRNALQTFLGQSYEENRDLYRWASPAGHIDSGDPPTLILHGTIDDVVRIDQADALAERLEAAGIAYLYDRLPGWPHAMDLSREVNERVVKLTVRFLEHVWSPRAETAVE